VRKETQIGRQTQDGAGGLWGSVTGLFAGFGRGAGGGGGGATRGTDRIKAAEAKFEEGEVHAELVKDDSGNFEWRYILVDMPNSRTRYPKRVFVQRREDVPQLEAVMRWY